jgi:hypothetical protein
MQYGDLEGLGTVYDSDGIVIPDKKECVMASFNGYVRKLERSIRHKWRVEFFDGLGLFVLTDKRVVYIRNPIKYESKFKFSGGRFATLSDWEYWTNRSNKAKEMGAKEFIEIPLNEIETVKNGKSYSILQVNDKNDKYRLMVDAHVGLELEKFQDKEKNIMPLICFEELKEEKNRSD